METVERVAYSPEEVAEALGVSRPTVYEILNREDFPSFKIGRRTLVSVEGLKAWVLRQAGVQTDEG